MNTLNQYIALFSGDINLTIFRVLIIIALVVPVVVEANTFMSDFSAYEDVELISDPTANQSFYGELDGFPHTYYFILKSDQELSFELFVPNIEEAKDDIGAIVVKKALRGSVEEVARLNPKTAEWGSFRKFSGGDSYRRGPSLSKELSAGEYILEVNTSVNEGKYVLALGALADYSGVGILKTWKQIYLVKRFYGKPPIAVLQSPYYFIPVTLILIVFFVWYRKRNIHA